MSNYHEETQTIPHLSTEQLKQHSVPVQLHVL